MGTRTYSSYSADLDISPRYHPQDGAESFTLPTFLTPVDYAAALPSELHKHYEGLLPVHPDTLAVVPFDGEPGPPLTVVPSANARTVFVSAVGGEPVAPHFLKLHYPRRLSRFTRRLLRPTIELHLWVARHLVDAGLPVLPEVGGGWVGGDPSSAWGFLVRAARPVTGGRTYTVPVFALYGQDRHAPSDPTLLEQVVERSGELATPFVAQRIVAPMVRLWVEALLRTGCPLETHGQNTLFGFDLDPVATSVLYRDSAVYVDAVLRARLGLPGPLPPANVIPRDVPMAAEEVFSLTYDSFMGHHCLDYVAALSHARLGVRPGVLQATARDAFAAATAGAPGGLLPRSVYYYDDVLYDDGDWKLVDLGEAPTWR